LIVKTEFVYELRRIMSFNANSSSARVSAPVSAGGYKRLGLWRRAQLRSDFIDKALKIIVVLLENQLRVFKNT